MERFFKIKHNTNQNIAKDSIFNEYFNHCHFNESFAEMYLSVSEEYRDIICI